MSKRKKFHCKSEAQKRAIKASYARKAEEKKNQSSEKATDKFPDKFPFWARLKISKNRTTLVIDEDVAFDKQKKKEVDGFVHREATSVYHTGFEEINPNPDKTKSEPMYLKSPRKLPVSMFSPHNKDLSMPEDLRQRYDKNNYKKKPAGENSDGDNEN